MARGGACGELVSCQGSDKGGIIVRQSESLKSADLGRVPA